MTDGNNKMEKLNIATFNLRCVWKSGDGINGFVNRAGIILLAIEREQPDVILFQETTEKNGAFLQKYLVDYDFYRNGRCDDYCGEGLAIALKKGVCTMLFSECFWLSPTPSVPGSRFAKQSKCPRICQAALVKKGERRFRVYNVHLDHEYEEARVAGIKVVLEKVLCDCGNNELPFFIAGDFNAEPESNVIELCNSFAGRTLVDLTKDSGTTFHAFGDERKAVKIDYIFADSDTAARGYDLALWKDEINGVFLSDHYPVSVIAELD